MKLNLGKVVFFAFLLNCPIFSSFAQAPSSVGTCNIYMNASVINRSTSFGEEQIVNGNYQGVAQQYNGLSGQLKAVFFRGRANPAAGSNPITVKVVVYNANLGYPGTILGTQNVTLNTSATCYDVVATFSSPINVNGDVIISVEPFSPFTDNFYVQRNTPPDGLFLNLTKIKQANQWFKNLAAGDPLFDYDFIIVPVTTSNVTAAFTSNTALNVTNFTNNSLNGVTYDWNFGDGGTSTATAPSHSYAASGIYNVRLIAIGNGITYCADTLTSPVNVVLSSIGEINNEISNISIQSNMVTEMLEISSKEKSSIKIVDTSGKELITVDLQKNSKQIVDVKSFPAGVYFIQTSNQNKLKFIKLNNN